MNKSSNESLNHWTNESINQWLNESAATYLGYLCSDLPPSQLTSSLRAAVTMPLATSSCNPPCQDRRNITDAFLHAAVLMRFVTAGCNPRIAGAPHQIDQCSRSADNGTSTAQIRRCSDFLIFLQFFCEIPRGCQFFNILTCKSSSRYSSVHFLSAIFANRPPNSRKQRPYFGDHGSHFTRQNTGFRAWECFHPGIHTGPNCYTSKLLDDGWLTWWCGWHDAMTIVRNLEVC